MRRSWQGLIWGEGIKGEPTRPAPSLHAVTPQSVFVLKQRAPIQGLLWRQLVKTALPLQGNGFYPCSGISIWHAPPPKKKNRHRSTVTFPSGLTPDSRGPQALLSHVENLYLGCKEQRTLFGVLRIAIWETCLCKNVPPPLTHCQGLISSL